MDSPSPFSEILVDDQRGPAACFQPVSLLAWTTPRPPQFSPHFTPPKEWWVLYHQELPPCEPDAFNFEVPLRDVVANRLGPNLQCIIPNCQSALIKSRSIHDNFVYVWNSM
jgi:hypothetical protein